MLEPACTLFAIFVAIKYVPVKYLTALLELKIRPILCTPPVFADVIL